MSDNSFLPGLAAFARSLGEHDTPFLNEIKKGPMREGPPIIGYTEDRRRGLQHVFRIGERVRLRVARLVPVEVCDDDGRCCQYWERNQWKWLWTVAIKAACRAPQPIYDPDWVDPNPPQTTMRWGWSAIEEKPEVDFNRLIAAAETDEERSEYQQWLECYEKEMEKFTSGAHLRTRGRTAGDPADPEATPPD